MHELLLQAAFVGLLVDPLPGALLLPSDIFTQTPLITHHEVGEDVVTLLFGEAIGDLLGSWYPAAQSSVVLIQERQQIQSRTTVLRETFRLECVEGGLSVQH